VNFSWEPWSSLDCHGEKRRGKKKDHRRVLRGKRLHPITADGGKETRKNLSLWKGDRSGSNVMS